MPSRVPFRVAVVGGGIGGLATAILLHRRCGADVSVTVYEQASQYREIGAGISLGQNAARLLREVPGLYEACRACSSDRDKIWMTFVRYDTGEAVLSVPEAEDDQGVESLFLARSDTLDVLLRFVREGTETVLRTDMKCLGIEECRDGVQLTFEDGTKDHADLVVGCDGIHSIVRNSCIGEDVIPYGGMLAYRAVVPNSGLPSPWPYPSNNVHVLAPGRTFLIYPIGRGPHVRLNVIAFVAKRADELPPDARESWTSVCEDRMELESAFSDFPPVVQTVLKMMPDRPARWQLNDRDPLATWHYMHGRVVLLGDAAHAMLPHQGAGAGQAVEDAYVLARAVGDFLAGDRESSLQPWMQLYQDVRRPRAQQVQATSRETGRMYRLDMAEFEAKPYQDCVPTLVDMLRNRFKWLWTEDIGAVYEKARTRAGLTGGGPN